MKLYMATQKPQASSNINTWFLKAFVFLGFE